MNILKAIHTPSPPSKVPFSHSSKLTSRKKSVICFCSSDGAESGSPSPSQGDKRKQELLAQIAMLQAQKLRVTNFLDERRAYLTKFAEDANAEFDQIGENALKELEDAGTRIMEKLDNQMEAFEETAEISREDIAKNEKVLEDFEEQIERDQNEGLFFKSLTRKAPKGNEQAKVEVRKLRETTRKNAGSKLRKNIYIVLMVLIAITMTNYLIPYPEVEWRKVAALGLILVGLLVQLIYEQNLSSTNEKMDKKED